VIRSASGGQDRSRSADCDASEAEDRDLTTLRDSPSRLSRGQVVYLATPDSTAVVKGSSTSDVLLLLKTELMMVTEVEDERS
jgi:hypothetical protein